MEKKGTKRLLLVDSKGVPLALVVTAANVPDVNTLSATLQAKIYFPIPGTEQHLCADAGFTGKRAEKVMTDANYIPHVTPQYRELRINVKNPNYIPRRWVVEGCHSWINRFRAMLIRFEKQVKNYYALLQLALAQICWRKAILR